MSFFQSCLILVFYSLNDGTWRVDKENNYITCWGFIQKFGQKFVTHVESVQYFKICVVSDIRYEESFWPNFCIKPQDIIYFIYLLFVFRHLSYRTLKSDSSEKLHILQICFFISNFPTWKKCWIQKILFASSYIIFSNEKT